MIYDESDKGDIKLFDRQTRFRDVRIDESYRSLCINDRIIAIKSFPTNGRITCAALCEIINSHV